MKKSCGTLPWKGIEMFFYSIFSLPETIDGGDGEGHNGGHATHDEDGHPHHPHDLVLARLEFQFCKKKKFL